MGLMKRRSEQKKTSFKSEESEEEKKIKEIECVARRCRDEIENRNVDSFHVINFLFLVFLRRRLVLRYLLADYVLLIPAVITIVKCLFVYNNGTIIPLNENIYDPRELLPKEEYSDFNWPAIKWALGFICPIPRYCDIIKYASKAKRTKVKTDDDTKNIYFLAMIWEDAELIQLRQFDCFMESTP
uniref:Uncharacterized protein n=1 Tax=Daphnia galeata TaxID=27404 RepID=A0A8J2RLC4_9CRUS|nr:unnamed protein product [Daphnia galeata]